MRSSTRRLLLTDHQRSVIGSMTSERQSSAYAPFGSSTAHVRHASRFTGEHQDRFSGNYLLGNGYRAYSPALRRFTSPDSWSPFATGGMNAYAYCKSDPVNYTDPTGHWRVIGPLTLIQSQLEDALTIIRFMQDSSSHLWRIPEFSVNGLPQPDRVAKFLMNRGSDVLNSTKKIAAQMSKSSVGTVAANNRRVLNALQAVHKNPSAKPAFLSLSDQVLKKPDLIPALSSERLFKQIFIPASLSAPVPKNIQEASRRVVQNYLDSTIDAQYLGWLPESRRQNVILRQG